MSAETDLSTKTVEVFIPLLNEGTEVLRPTKRVLVGSNVVKLLPAAGYDSEVEEWKFPPGSKVGCVWEDKSGRRVLVARQRIA